MGYLYNLNSLTASSKYDKTTPIFLRDSMAYRLKNLRILVIDSNMPVRNLIRSILLDLGFGVVDAAKDTEEAWTMYHENRPDTILLDWRLDDTEALNFVRRIRMELGGSAQRVPVIIMTGHTNKERVMLARDTGVTEFLIKPFTINALVKHFTNLIEKPRDFVKAPSFVGPDRRRRADGSVPDKKRKQDTLSAQKKS